MCGSTGVSAFNAFSRPPTLHDAPAPMCQTANARTVEHPSAAFAHEAAAMRPRDMWAAAAAAAASKNFKDAAGTAPQATVRGPLETWLWSTAPRDDALKVGMQSIENEYQRNLQRAHESYQREIQLHEQAYNAAAATSAILSLHKLAAANNMPVSLDLLGIDPSALAGKLARLYHACSVISLRRGTPAPLPTRGLDARRRCAMLVHQQHVAF